MSARLILVGGGARSGKSAFALALARRLAAGAKQGPLFMATGQAYDDEMRARIDRHRSERGPAFETREEPLLLAEALGEVHPERVVLIDCLTLWLSNLLLADGEIRQEEILGRVERLVAVAAARSGPTLVVSNEVGMAVVPEHALGRVFRDLTGMAHQRLAALAGEVYLAVMGLVLRVHPAPLLSLRPGELP